MAIRDSSAAQRARTHRGSRAIIEHLLELLASPAFVVDAAGKVLEASCSGKVMFDTNPREITGRLAAAIDGEGTHFTTSRIGEAGTPLYYVAVARVSSDARIVHAIANAAVHWLLTPRQRDVLGRVARGVATSAIAEQMRISTRAVDLHITRLFDKAGVESRAGLVAAVLAGVR